MRSFAAPLLFTLAVGCGPRIVALEPNKIVSFQLPSPTGSQAICANEPGALFRVDVRYRDGKRLATVRDGKVDAIIKPGEIHWTTSVGSIDPGGALVVPVDRLGWLDRPVTVRATIARDPGQHRELVLTPVYDCGVVRASGQPGGTEQPGGQGADVDVALSFVDLSDHRRWVLARVEIEGRVPEYYVIDPGSSAPGTRPGRAGRFVVEARGGAGGDGAAGADGANGSDGAAGTDGSSGVGCEDGGDGSSGGNGEDGGNGEPGGPGANGGDGGRITVRYDARFPELARMLDYAVDGGSAGAGGRGGRGGSGGAGGRGGKGGSGGSGDSTRNCTTRSGSDGSDGQSGRSGYDGSSGSAGLPGRAGEVRAVPVAVEELFPSELGHGVPLAK